MDILQGYQSTNIKLDATHNQMKMRLTEITFDKHWTIGQVKHQLERRFGSAVADQNLQLKNASGDIVCDMTDDAKTLDQYGAKDNYCIHCIDHNKVNNFAEFEDLSKVEKYVMADADYDKRSDTFRKFRER